MKVFVVHDSQGHITAIAVPPPDPDAELLLMPGLNEFANEVELEREAPLDVSSEKQEKLAEHLRAIARSYQVDFSAAEAKLVRRQ